MATRHILMVDSGGQADLVSAGIQEISSALELVCVSDGVQCIGSHAKLARAGRPPLVVVLEYQMDYVNGVHAARLIRAIESGLGVSPSAIIFRCDESEIEDINALTKAIGRAAPLKRIGGSSLEAQGQRLVKAIAKILSQLRKRGKG